MKPEQESSSSSPDLPAVIDTIHPYIAIGDLYYVAKCFIPDITDSEVASLQSEKFALQNQFMAQESTFYATSATRLAQRLEIKSLDEANRTDKSVGVVQLDRYIAANINHPHFFRLNVSRARVEGHEEILISRPGTHSSPEEQLQALKDWIIVSNFNEVVLVDDVLAFGSTLLPIIERLKQEIPGIQVRVLVGIGGSGGAWQGVEKIQQITDGKLECLTIAKAGEEDEYGNDMVIPPSRDMTIFGGDLSTSATVETPIAFPLYMPFTVPKPWFIDRDQKVEGSHQTLDFDIKFVSFLEEHSGRPILVQDLVENGFGVPYTKIPLVMSLLPFPEPSTRVTDYLLQAKTVLEEQYEEILQTEKK